MPIPFGADDGDVFGEVAREITPQIELAMAFYAYVSDNASGMPIEVTGHSLGGGLAGVVAAVFRLAGAVFDNIAYEGSAQAISSVAAVGAGFKAVAFPGEIAGRAGTTDP